MTVAMKMGKPEPDDAARMDAIGQIQYLAAGVHDFDMRDIVRRFEACWDAGVHLGSCMSHAFFWGFRAAVMGTPRKHEYYTGDGDADFCEYDGDDVDADFEGVNGDDAESQAQDASSKWAGAAWLLGWDQGHDYMLSKGGQK